LTEFLEVFYPSCVAIYLTKSTT